MIQDKYSCCEKETAIKLSKIITPQKFRLLADFITICEKQLGLSDPGTDVQNDLRKFADALEDMSDSKFECQDNLS